MASPADPANTGKAKVGKPSPAECRTVRSLRCGPAIRGLLSPWGVVRFVLHLLLDAGGKLLAPWSGVLLRAVVCHSCKGHGDQLLQSSPLASLNSAHGLPDGHVRTGYNIKTIYKTSNMALGGGEVGRCVWV